MEADETSAGGGGIGGAPADGADDVTNDDAAVIQDPADYYQIFRPQKTLCKS